MQMYEIEVKSLLGNAGNADNLRQKMKVLDPTCTVRSKNKQLNHYFIGSSLPKLAQAVGTLISQDANTKLKDFAKRAKNFSVRTREKGDAVLLVVKASVDDTTSENGIARMEFEEKVPMTLDALDQLVLSARFTYQAKWSREREEYLCRGTTVTLDKNAGYGWLAEFERIVDAESKAADAQKEIRSLMRQLGCAELPQDRLARMFDYYNTHWQEYYGTDKIFVIE